MKVGYVAILGRPNVGKSTLLNRLLGNKLVAVSPKPQTTRHKIRGILTTKDYQIVFLDTPGILEPRYTLHKVMLDSALSALNEADVPILMVEPFGIDMDVVDKVGKAGKPTVIVINKVDLAKDPEGLKNLIEEYKKFDFVKDVVPISALYSVGLAKLIEVIVSLLPEGEILYPEDMISDYPERFFVGEIIREKIFHLYRQEVPYATAVVVEDFIEREKGKYYIRAVIYVERESEKKILIGKGGQKLKQLGQQARKDIEAFINHPVYLELWVKVKKDWRRDPTFLQRFSYTS